MSLTRGPRSDHIDGMLDLGAQLVYSHRIVVIISHRPAERFKIAFEPFCSPLDFGFIRAAPTKGQEQISIGMSRASTDIRHDDR